MKKTYSVSVAPVTRVERDKYSVLAAPNMQFVFPLTFISELERFKGDNALAQTYSLTRHRKVHCCMQCLKAFALQKAQEMNFDPHLVACIHLAFPGEIGHDGYYLNHEQLVLV